MGKRDVHDKEKPCLEPLTRKRIATVLTVQFDDVTTVRVPIRPVPLRANHPSVPDADENGAVPFGSNTDIETLEGWRIPHRLQPQPQRSIPSIAIFTKKQKVVPRNLTATAASLSATVDVESSSFKDFPTTGIVIEAGTKHRHGKNRLHQERPVRVTSVVDALERHGLLERCKLVSSSSEQAESFLQDEDYLRVHSFGYFERYV